VNDTALQATQLKSALTFDKAKAVRRFRLPDATFRIVSRSAAELVLIILTGVVVSLIHGSIPVFNAMGFDFFYLVLLEPCYRTLQRWRRSLWDFGNLRDCLVNRSAYRFGDCCIFNRDLYAEITSSDSDSN